MYEKYVIKLTSSTTHSDFLNQLTKTALETQIYHFAVYQLLFEWCTFWQTVSKVFMATLRRFGEEDFT